MTSTELLPRRRLALVLAAHSAEAAAPAGTQPAAFARACLADAYEVLADLAVVRSGIAGPDWTAELLWPGALRLPAAASVGELAAGLAEDFDDLVVVPADVPDLPGLVVAKVFRVLPRVDLAIAPRGGRRRVRGVGDVPPARGTGWRPICWTSTAARSTGCGPIGCRGPAGRWCPPGTGCALRTTCVGSTPGWRAGRKPALSWPTRHCSRTVSGASLDGGLGSRGHPGRPIPRAAGTAPHLYGHAMRAMADDWEAGGPVRRVFAGLRGRTAGIGGSASAAGRGVPAGADRPDAGAGAVLRLPGAGPLIRRLLAGDAPGDR